MRWQLYEKPKRMGDAPLCGICEEHPATEDDPLCPMCRVEFLAASHIITDPVEIVLGQHLPMKLPDGRIMCTCHCEEGDGLFHAPGYYRRHVAALIREALDLPPGDPWKSAVEETEQ
jgi:hypothetical protein